VELDERRVIQRTEHNIHYDWNRSLHKARTAEYIEEIDFIRASGYLFGVTIKNARGYVNQIVFGSSYFISL
jgi:UDP-3-O-acyl-N-acetylglucosamine deacetylase